MTALDKPTLTLEMPVTLRLATYDDLPRLEWYGQYTHFRALFRRTYQEQLQHRRLMLVADCNDFPIGNLFVQLRGGEQRQTDGRRRAYFYSLRVMEMFQGHGIGTSLIYEAEQLAAEQHFQWATIAAATDNPRARRLYERLGYNVFAQDDGKWSYRDHENRVRYVHEPCWVLEKRIEVR
ncbi:MAG: GNAT family N-acetyltransferase [Chloroflexota bacterium]